VALDCQPGTPVDCDDGDPCTDDYCDEVNDVCVNADATYIAVDLEIESLMNPVTRDVTFVITDCDGGSETRVVPVVFDAGGMGGVTLTEVDTGADWIRATEGHTLSRLLPLVFDGPDGCSADVQFTVSDRLLAGDYSNAHVPQDNLVDIQDFSILAIEWNMLVDPNASTLADATGDGVQDAWDFAPIQANFVETGDDVDNCGTLGTAPRLLSKDFGKSRITVDMLPTRHAEYADLNNDRVIDATDIRIFAQRHDLVLTAEFDAKLRRLEARDSRLRERD
jgi:hypothetical protein